MARPRTRAGPYPPNLADGVGLRNASLLGWSGVTGFDRAVGNGTARPALLGTSGVCLAAILGRLLSGSHIFETHRVIPCRRVAPLERSGQPTLFPRRHRPYLW